MDYKISDIQVAGAGAGKTYSMAEKIIEYRKNNVTGDKDIIVITYTNFAKNNIENKFRNEFNGTPENVKILTIHKFLLDYIIYPYSNLIFNLIINDACSIPLSDKISFKNKRISELLEKGIIHNEKVFKQAKRTLCIGNSDNKELKKNKGIVLNLFKASVCAIFIDEAQDADEDVMEIIKYLNNNGIYFYIVGDPKQAIKYPNVFSNFINEIKTNKVKSFNLQPFNNVTRRMPKMHVNISNIICNADEKQSTISKVEGTIYYMYSDDDNFKEVFDKFQNSESLCYIKRKTDYFLTSKSYKLDDVLLKEMLITKNISDDADAFIYEKTHELFNYIENFQNEQKGLNYFLKKYNITLSRDDYAKIISTLSFIKEDKYLVNTIDKIKGLEKENCLFIIDNSLLDYLFRNKIEENKERNYLYVGLTRSLGNMLLVIDTSTLKDKTKEYIDSEMKKISIPYYVK